MSTNAARRFPEFHRMLQKLGQPKGEHSLWTNPHNLNYEDNDLCMRVWEKWKGVHPMVKMKDRNRVMEIYAKVFETDTDKLTTTEPKGS